VTLVTEFLVIVALLLMIMNWPPMNESIMNLNSIPVYIYPTYPYMVGRLPRYGLGHSDEMLDGDVSNTHANHGSHPSKGICP
jgi:hypothetical protein